MPILLSIAVTCLTTAKSSSHTTKHWLLKRDGIVVSIQMGSFRNSQYSRSLYWGWYTGDLNAIRDISIRYKTHEIDVPLSCYSDLSNVNDVQLTPKKKGAYVLTIDGGDASTGYEAKIFFDSKNVYRREVHDGEESEYDYEVTNYTNKVPPDP